MAYSVLSTRYWCRAVGGGGRRARCRSLDGHRRRFRPAQRAGAATVPPARRFSMSAISSDTSSSVSRQAVPLPMAITVVWCLRTSASSRDRASALRFCGGCGKMTPSSRRLPCLVQRRHLAAGAEAGIDGQHAAAAQRRRQQQAAQVAREDADGVRLGPVGQLLADLALQAGQQQAGQGVGRHGAAGSRRAGGRPAAAAPAPPSAPPAGRSPASPSARSPSRRG